MLAALTSLALTQGGSTNALTSVPDVTGDGVCELALAPRGMRFPPREGWRPTPSNRVGRLVLLDGSDGELLWVSEAPGDWIHESRLEEYAWRIAGTPDANCDGLGDVWVGASGCLVLLDGASGRIDRYVWTDDQVRSLAVGPDLDSDGFPEVIVGVGRDAHGGVDVLSGASGEVLSRLRVENETYPAGTDELPITIAIDWQNMDRSWFDIGTAVGFLADRNNDAVPEFVICDSLEPDAPDGTGTRVICGASGEVLQVFSTGGCIVRELGDLDGDGLGELLTVGSVWYGDPFVRCLGSRSGETLWSFNAESSGMYLDGGGSTLELLDDMDGDGAPDFLLGANEWDDIDEGWLSVCSSRTGRGIRSLNTSHVTDSPSATSGGLDGMPVDDIDGDGLRDVALWCWSADRIEVRSSADWRLIWQNHGRDLWP